MKKIKVLLAVAAMLLLFGCFSASAAGNSIANAQQISFDTQIQESITETQREDYYKINLSSSGRINISFTSYMRYYCIYIYNQDGVELWCTEYNEWISTTGMRKDTHTIDLEKGTYYIKVTGYKYWSNAASTGNYNFSIKYTASGANVAEPNNNIAQAKAINLGSTVKGQIAINDREDYYKINLSSSGRINISFTSYMQYYCIYIYNQDGVELWYTDYNEWISTTGMRKDTHTIDLEKGTYYIKVTGYRDGTWNDSTGNYNFSIKYTASGANVAEPNNNIAQAKAINLGSTVKGQIAINDREDYYKLTLSSKASININFTSYMQYYCIYIYNQDGVELWYTDGNEWTPTTQKCQDKYKLDLSKGTYYIKVTGYCWGTSYASTGTYSFSVSPIVNVGKVNAINASQTSSTITLKWNKVSGAKGYQIYQYNSSKKKYEKIATTSGTSYKVSKLKSATKYKFKIRAYKNAYNTNYYGSYGSISVTTKPSTPTLKASAASKSASLSWSKVSGANGYVIYMSTSKNSGYKAIKTITKSKTVSYKKTGLTRGKTYYFKIKAYKTVDGKKLYSAASSYKAVKVK